MCVYVCVCIIVVHPIDLIGLRTHIGQVVK